jgi:hypothetical protein
MDFRRPGLTAAELKIQKLMIYSTDQPSWVALDIVWIFTAAERRVGSPPNCNKLLLVAVFFVVAITNLVN